MASADALLKYFLKSAPFVYFYFLIQVCQERLSSWFISYVVGVPISSKISYIYYAVESPFRKVFHLSIWPRIKPTDHMSTAPSY